MNSARFVLAAALVLLPRAARGAEPFLGKQDLFVAGGNSAHDVYHIPGIVVTARGTVLAWCEARRGGGDWSDIMILLRRSTDDGRTWSEPRSIVKVSDPKPKNPFALALKNVDPDHVTYNNPVLIADRDGTVHMLFCLEYMRCFYQRSTDDGLSWSPPVEITSCFTAFKPAYPWTVLATGPNHGIQLRTGRLVVPVWLSTGTGGNAHRPSVTATIYSDDGGRSWKAGGIAVPNTDEWINPNETVAVELADGRVMLNVRSESKAHRRIVTESADGATGWSRPRFDEALLEPICMAGIVRYDHDGRRLLLFSNPHTLEGSRGPQTAPGTSRIRKNVSVKLSRDEGGTWPVNRLLEDGPSGYSDIAVTPAGTILCFYGAAKTPSFSGTALRLARFNLAWLESPSAPISAEPVTNSLGMTLVPVQPGTFTMGQDGPPLEDYLRQKRFGDMWKDIDRADFDEQPAHTVTITHPFLMGATEVTVSQYRQFDPDFQTRNPKSKPADDDAACGVTWEKAVAFCEWLSRKEGRPYRLPTEAEWEYACRAGTTTPFHTGHTLPDGHQKWFGDDNYRGVYFPPGPMPREYDWRTTGTQAAALKQGQIIGLDHPAEESRAGGAGSLRVAKKTPNAWGLHDMHGNVAEWCSDWYGPYEGGPQTNPLGRVDGDCHVFRGGFHSSMIRFLRSANRGSWVANSASPRIGFRVVQAALPPGKPLAVAAPPQNARDVSQTVKKFQPASPDQPFFEGPKPFVRIPDGAVGPVFISQNHSPSITECPNGDLLAVWFSTLGETDLTTANAASRLRSGGREWEPASAFWDAQDVNDHAPKIWWDGAATIHHIVEARQHGDVLIRRSTDNGVTWSKPDVMRARGESAGNPIRTRAGVIAVPFDFSGLSVSHDDGRTWRDTGRDRRGSDDIRPGGQGPFIAGIHAPIVELADGRLMAFGRLSAEEPVRKHFHNWMPVSSSSDLGETWRWEASGFPVVSNTQRPAMLRLKEGPILLCSFTDEARTPKNERTGLSFASTAGDYTGYGLYAAVSYDEGKTWPDRRLVAAEGKSLADINGYLAVTQSRDGNIQLVTSKDHYTFNLAWLRSLPSVPKP